MYLFVFVDHIHDIEIGDSDSDYTYLWYECINLKHLLFFNPEYCGIIDSQVDVNRHAKIVNLWVTISGRDSDL